MAIVKLKSKKMEKVFDRKMSKELADKIKQLLNTELGVDFDFTTEGGKFTDDKLVIKLACKIKGSDGAVVVSDDTHRAADAAVERSGYKVIGHLIGSVWRVKEDLYEVTGYNTRRPKYPCSLRRADGKSAKAPISFLVQGEQLTQPTRAEFTTWFSVDPDSDAVRESDVEICDRVQDYLDVHFMEAMDKYYPLVDKINEIGVKVAKKLAPMAYENLFIFGAEKAYKHLKTEYKKLK